ERPRLRPAHHGRAHRGRWRRADLAAVDGHAAGQGVPADQRADPRARGGRAGAGQPGRRGRRPDGRGRQPRREDRRDASASRAEHQARAEHAHQAGSCRGARVRAAGGVHLVRHPRAPRDRQRLPGTLTASGGQGRCGGRWQHPGRRVLGRGRRAVTGPTGAPAAAADPAGPADSPRAGGPLAEDLDAYRLALRGHLATEPAFKTFRGRRYPSTEARMADHARLERLLHDAGWNRYGWPPAAGGLGGDERHRAVLYDELAAAGLPVPGQHMLLETLGPPVVRFAQDLAAAHLPAYLRGEEWWGQGFSEPEAGSDLASLRCRARRDGDTYVVTGQKLWTSHGATATRLVCLVRTGTPESRHRALSMIMIDVDTPGVTIRPIAMANGDNELAEV